MTNFMRCPTCHRAIKGCNCASDEGYDKVFYRVKPFDWNFKPAGRSGTQYAIEECRVVATSRVKEDAENLVARLNEWKRLKRDNARLRSLLAARDTGKIELYRVENIVADEVAKTGAGWASMAGKESLKTLAKRIMTRCGWATRGDD